jgi:MFS family permease
MRLSRPLAMLYTTGFLRSLGVGMLGVVLGVYLSRLGFTVTRIGLVLGAGLAGISISTVLVSVLADRIGRRRSRLAGTCPERSTGSPIAIGVVNMIVGFARSSQPNSHRQDWPENGAALSQLPPQAVSSACEIQL